MYTTPTIAELSTANMPGVYALTIDEGLEDAIRPWGAADSRAGDVTILHFAVPSPMTAGEPS